MIFICFLLCFLELMTSGTFMVLGCNAGSTTPNISTTPCSPCTLGSYFGNLTLGTNSTCALCPPGTTTLATGSAAIFDCRACTVGYCNGGSCSVDMDTVTAMCTCPDDFTGVRCDEQVPSAALPAAAWAVPVAFSLTAILAVGIYLYIHRKRMQKTHHIFISYRVNADAALARTVCMALQREFVEGEFRVNCFFDKQDIQEGSNWEHAFVTGLHQSCVFLPLVSAAAIQPIERVSMFDDKADNLLLEYEIALRLAARKRIAILPLLVGTGRSEEDYAPFAGTEFNVDRFPNGPSKTHHHGPIRETMRGLFRIQGVFVHPWALTQPEVDVIVQFLRQKAWGSSDPECLRLKRFWNRPPVETSAAADGSEVSVTSKAESEGSILALPRRPDSFFGGHDSLRRRLLADRADDGEDEVRDAPMLSVPVDSLTSGRAQSTAQSHV